MSNIIAINKLQNDVLWAQDRIVVITAEPGAGSTYALAIKAIDMCKGEDGLNASFFSPTVTHINSLGGIRDVFVRLAPECRYSEKSMIFSFPNGSKIKLVPCTADVENTLGLSKDLMLFDANINNKFIQRHILRAYKAVVVDDIESILRLGSWANELNLLKVENGVVKGFVDGIAHVKGRLLDNFFLEIREKYYDMAFNVIPKRFNLDFEGHQTE